MLSLLVRRKRWVMELSVLVLLALLCASGFSLLVPMQASAHSILLKSDPAQGSVLKAPPKQIRMWFSEELNATFTTAYVVNAATTPTQAQNDSSTHVDLHDAHIAGSSRLEMDVSLKPDLPSAVYLVIYRTQSLDDGHILYGSFTFTVAGANGSVPTVAAGSSNTGVSTGSSTTSGQLDASGWFSFLGIALVDIGVIFWTGGQLWRVFVLHLLKESREGNGEENRDEERSGEDDEARRTILWRMERRFDRFYSPLLLLLILLASVGVVIGQALSLTNDVWGQAIAPSLLASMVAQGDFAFYWKIRMGMVAFALLLALASLPLSRSIVAPRPSRLREPLEWLYLLLALGLIGVVALSGHAAAASDNILIWSVLSDLLHLLGASLWIGCMFYLSLVYLPLLSSYSDPTSTDSLLTVLRRYSPLAFTGVALIALSGPLNATVHIDAWSELLTTAYGRTLVVKILLVCLLLLVSAYHVFLLRPRLKETYRRYQDVQDELAAASQVAERPAAQPVSAVSTDTLARPASGDEARLHRTFVAAERKVLERDLGTQSQRLIRVIRWEPMLGLMVLLCTGLLGAFAGTLQAPTSQSTQGAVSQSVATKPYETQLTTKDKLYTITVKISPDTFGPNTFTAIVHDKHGQRVPASKIGVTFYLTMLDMDMGTQSVNLQPDKDGNFSAQDSLGMNGHWELKVNVQGADSTLHSATVEFKTPVS